MKYAYAPATMTEITIYREAMSEDGVPFLYHNYVLIEIPVIGGRDLRLSNRCILAEKTKTKNKKCIVVYKQLFGTEADEKRRIKADNQAAAEADTEREAKRIVKYTVLLPQTRRSRSIWLICFVL